MGSCMPNENLEDDFPCVWIISTKSASFFVSERLLLKKHGLAGSKPVMRKTFHGKDFFFNSSAAIPHIWAPRLCPTMCIGPQFKSSNFSGEESRVALMIWDKNLKYFWWLKFLVIEKKKQKWEIKTILIHDVKNAKFFSLNENQPFEKLFNRFSD